MLGGRRVSGSDPAKGAVNSDKEDSDKNEKEEKEKKEKEEKEKKEKKEKEENKYEPAVFVVKHPNFTPEESYVTCNAKGLMKEIIDAFCESTRIPEEELLFSEPLTGTALVPTMKMSAIGARTIFVKYLGPQESSSFSSSGLSATSRTFSSLYFVAN
jgi:hypothetical protein